jgi:hypothetical protein
MTALSTRHATVRCSSEERSDIGWIRTRRDGDQGHSEAEKPA